MTGRLVPEIIADGVAYSGGAFPPIAVSREGALLVITQEGADGESQTFKLVARDYERLVQAILSDALRPDCDAVELKQHADDGRIVTIRIMAVAAPLLCMVVIRDARRTIKEAGYDA